MNKEITAKFKALFEAQRANLLFSDKIMDESFVVAPEEMKDDVDFTSSELETGMRMRLRNREALFVKKIDEALERIAHGTFGECDCCGDNIEVRRLEARPTATLCVTCKEDSERMENVHIDGHRSKSLGFKLRLA